jgi:uncharacterized membrane protein
MKNRNAEALIPLALLAAVSGARTSSGIAAAVPAAPTRLLALGELILDKLPGVPDRIEPRLIAGRIAAGALVGAIVGGRTGNPRGESAIIGGLIAFASAHATYRMRRALGKRLPAFAAALAEDAIVVGAAAAGAAMLRSDQPR